MRTSGLALSLLCAAGTALAQQGLLQSDDWGGTIDVRNRWVSDINGSSQVYRSIVNLGEGPRLFEGELRFANPGARWADRAALTMNAWGGDPYNTAHFTAEKNGLYDLSVDYRNVAYFNNLPTFANPLLASGLTLSQRAYDIRRRQLDVDLRFRPGQRLTPFANLSRGSGGGRGSTLFVSDGNEFAVDTDLNDRLLTARGGVTISNERWSATVEQGYTDFSDGQEVSWNDGPNRGNRRFPLLGRELSLDRLFQAYDVNGSGPFSRAVIQATPWSRVSLTGPFTYSQNKINVTQNIDAAGELVYASLLTPYTSLLETNYAQASQPRPSGNWSAEFRLHPRLRFVQSWYSDRFHVTGSAALSQLLDASPELAITEFSDRRIDFRYSQNQVDLIFEPERRISLRAGHRYSWGEAELPPPEFDLRPEPKTQVAMRRHVGLASAAVRLAGGRLRIGAQAEFSPGSEMYFRTGLDDYWRGKLRVSYRASSALTLHSSYATMANRNDDPQIELDMQSRQFSAGFIWTPEGRSDLSILADYTRSTLASRILMIQLPFFLTGFAGYEDDGHSGSAFVQTGLPYGASLKAGGSLFAGSGSRPTRFYNPQIALDGRVTERIRWVGEWQRYGFSESLWPTEDFRSNTISVGLRFSL